MHVPHVYLKGTFMSVNKLPLEIYSTDNWQYLGKFYFYEHSCWWLPSWLISTKTWCWPHPTVGISAWKS